MIAARQRYEPGALYSSRHVATRLDRAHEIATHMHDERGHAQLREQLPDVKVTYDFKKTGRAFW